MSGMWERTLIYLGLKEEPEEGYDEPPERDLVVDDPATARGDVNVRQLRPSGPEPAPEPVAEPAPAGGRVAVVDVRDFEDAEAVGARYRTGQPVVFDAAGASSETARRVLDFVSGITYALHGNMEKVGTRAFLLVPERALVDEEEAHRLRSLGYRLSTGSDA